jgi:hypothetical protein
MIGITFVLTSLALGFGALYPNYDTDNVAEVPTFFGGALFMMAAVLYLGGVVILEAWPRVTVFEFPNAEWRGPGRHDAAARGRLGRSTPNNCDDLVASSGRNAKGSVGRLLAC